MTALVYGLVHALELARWRNAIVYLIETQFISKDFLRISATLLVSYLDIDECEINTPGCSQLCNNNIGSYTCGCNPGYNLAPNGKSCRGKFSLKSKELGLLNYIHVHLADCRTIYMY